MTCSLPIGQMDSDVGIYGCGIYTQPNEVQAENIQYRALYEYKPQRPDELAFKKGEIITNVLQHSSDW